MDFLFVAVLFAIAIPTVMAMKPAPAILKKEEPFLNAHLLKSLNRLLGLHFTTEWVHEANSRTSRFELTLRHEELVVSLIEQQILFPSIGFQPRRPLTLSEKLNHEVEMFRPVSNRTEFHTGIPYLDRRFKFKAASPKFLALLDEGMTQRLDCFQSIDMADATCRFKGPLSKTFVKQALIFCESMVGADIRQRALSNLESDSAPTRRVNLTVLAYHFPLDRQIRQKAEHMLKDNDLSTCLTAAHLLKVEVTPLLVRLIQEHEHPLSKVIEKLASINEKGVGAQLHHLLRGPHGHKLLVDGLVPLMARHGNESFVAELCDLARRLANETNNRLIARALGEIGSQSANDFLIELCKNDEISQEVVRALGKCGTVTAVPHLLRYINTLRDRSLASQIREAVASIQMRLGDVERGWLTLGEQGAQGGLSLMSDHRGDALALNENDDLDKGS